MCSRFEFKGKEFRPGMRVVAIGANGFVCHPWAGFARSEIIAWWRRHGGVEIDIPATRFAERSQNTGELRWSDVPVGQVIRAIVDTRTGQPLIRVATRASTREELARFDHPRMPVIAAPLHVVPPGECAPDKEGSPDLFRQFPARNSG